MAAINAAEGGVVISDQVLNSYVENFASEHDLKGLKSDDLFECFVNSTVVSKLFGQLVDPLDVGTGPNAFGLDGIAVLVNDQLVLSADEVEERSRTRLDAHFVFLQSKTGQAFDTGEILKFMEAVRGFFGPSPLPKETEQVTRFRKAKDEIYKRSIKMEVAPACELYYVTCGKWTEDPLLLKTIEQAKESLRATGLFSEVKFAPVDTEKLKSYYRALKQQVVKQVTFEKYAVLPRMVDVDQAYIGVLPAKEYLKLIVDQDGNLERHLFYDNVRDFQGDNAVNLEISESIRAAIARQDKFAILNNGITIVAREIRPIGAEFTVRDYQVVNGCQTSHVLFFNRAFLTDGLFVPVKLIATSSQEVANLVIKATNRQTEVKEEAFAALEPFHKKLEEFYASVTDPATRLFYERRSRQYARDNIAPGRIVSITVQTKAYVAMLSGEPHNSHHYYGELLKTYWQSKKEMYQEEHDPWPYHAAALSFVETDKVLRTNNTKFRPYRHHILALLGMKFFGQEPRTIFKQSGKRIAAASKELEGFWKRPEDAAKEVLALASFVEGCYEKSGRGEMRWDATQRRDFTEEVKQAYRKLYEAEQAKVVPSEAVTLTAARARFRGPRVRGTIKRVGPEFGFISDQNGQDVFFHRSSIVEAKTDNLAQGLSVEFTPVLAPRGLKAVDIVVH